jgi:hypothetical protein
MAWNPASGQFPSPVSMSQVVQGLNYSISQNIFSYPVNLSSFFDPNYVGSLNLFNTDGTPYSIPTGGVNNLAYFSGRWFLNPAPVTVTLGATTFPNPPPLRPSPPYSFAISLVGAGGGGGGGGGGGDLYNGGGGGPGGGGGIINTGQFPYIQGLFSGITFTSSIGGGAGGAGGNSGLFNGDDGSPGIVGSDAVVVYNGTTYTAEGGLGGGKGIGGTQTQSGPYGAGGVGGGFIISPSDITAVGTTGGTGVENNAGGPAGTYQNGGHGGVGSNGNISIQWVFTP